MTVRRLIGIIFIFGCVTLAWMILGSSVDFRTEHGYESLGRQVETLWGTPHLQRAPRVSLIGRDERPVALDSSEINVDLQLEHRRKGLLWYPTYKVNFDGRYAFRNPLSEPATATITYQFPSSDAIYDGFLLRINETEIPPDGGNGESIQASVQLAPNEATTVHVTYDSRGLEEWRYSFGEGISTVKDFTLIVETDFDAYDFPARTISASSKEETPQGRRLEWAFNNLVSDFDVGVRMPQKRNPGPLASRMSFFAPVSLLFFFTVLVVLGAVLKVDLHPMHYFFLGASFFAFHLLFAYLVDHVVLELSFISAAVVSMGLVVSYLWRVVGWRFALREAGLSQLLFLVFFSYAFFFEGYTGLVVTVGAIATLAALMQITAKVDWNEVFSEKKDQPESDATEISVESPTTA